MTGIRQSEPFLCEYDLVNANRDKMNTTLQNDERLTVRRLPPHTYLT